STGVLATEGEDGRAAGRGPGLLDGADLGGGQFEHPADLRCERAQGGSGLGIYHFHAILAYVRSAYWSIVLRGGNTWPRRFCCPESWEDWRYSPGNRWLTWFFRWGKRASADSANRKRRCWRHSRTTSRSRGSTSFPPRKTNRA